MFWGWSFLAASLDRIYLNLEPRHRTGSARRVRCAFSVQRPPTRCPTTAGRCRTCKAVHRLTRRLQTPRSAGQLGSAPLARTRCRRRQCHRTGDVVFARPAPSRCAHTQPQPAPRCGQNATERVSTWRLPRLHLAIESVGRYQRVRSPRFWRKSGQPRQTESARHVHGARISRCPIILNPPVTPFRPDARPARTFSGTPRLRITRSVLSVHPTRFSPVSITPALCAGQSPPVPPNRRNTRHRHQHPTASAGCGAIRRLWRRLLLRHEPHPWHRRLAPPTHPVLSRQSPQPPPHRYVRLSARQDLPRFVLPEFQPYRRRPDRPCHRPPPHRCVRRSPRQDLPRFVQPCHRLPHQVPLRPLIRACNGSARETAWGAWRSMESSLHAGGMPKVTCAGLGFRLVKRKSTSC